MVHAMVPDTHAGRAARTLPRLFEAGAALHARHVFLPERRADRYVREELRKTG